ncbi:MAG: alpha-galactosidase [Ardenticatenaceae bacterium]|nr:alpha-galactosidase [Ardenticatenaceae bacterium]
MIHFNPQTQTFNLVLQQSHYAFQIDDEGRAVHLGWGPRPAGADDADLITGTNTAANLHFKTQGGFKQNPRRDELLTFGDSNQHEVSLKVNFQGPPLSVEKREPMVQPIRDVRLRYAGHKITGDAQPGLSPTIPPRRWDPRQTLLVFMEDHAYQFLVTLCYRLTPEHDVIERWCEFKNQGESEIVIEMCSFGSLHFPTGTTELTSVAGVWCREFMTQREQLPIGTRVLETRGINTGHTTNPFFLINRPHQAWEETGTVYFGQLAYSGNWRIAIEQTPTFDIRLHGGYNPFDFELKLSPDEHHRTPALVCGVASDGWGGASRRMHAFTRDRILPHPQRDTHLRPVLYNSWEATRFDLSFEGQVELARKAADIGVELFCVDDGWFGGRREADAGLGDWVVSPDVFPDGLEPLIAEVHSLGMKFGLWVEPEMVNPDSDLYRRHPDWVLHFPGRPRTEARNQLVLDFGRREVVATIFAALDKLLSQYDIAFLKWDMNRYATEPGSVAGKEIWLKHVEGVYDLIDRLRRNHPTLDIQSCSGGGGRVDLGILGRTDQVWPSDNTDAFDRIDIQEGFSLAYPARIMEAWVTDVPQHYTRRMSPLSTRFDVAMRGALGIGSTLNKLDDDELAEYANYIAFYKRIRHIVQEGQLYRLARMEEFGASVVQYGLADQSEAVYSIVVGRNLYGSYRPARPLKNLNSKGVYRLVDRHGQEVHRASGYELMTLGVPGDAKQNVGYSRTLHVQQI